MTIDPNDMGRVSLINSEALQHTLGRIEEALRGLREDLHEMIISQKAFDRRMDDETNRVEILERWRSEKESKDGARKRFIAASVALLFLPTVGWSSLIVSRIYNAIQHVEDLQTQDGKKR